MRKLGIILIGLLVAMTSVVMAQPADEGPGRDEMGPPPRGPRHEGGRRAERPEQGKRLDDFFKAVGASEEQQEKLKDIFKAQHEKIRSQAKDNREKYRDAMKAMREATTKEEFQTANKQLKELFQQRMKLHKQFQAKLGEVLDEQQLEKAKNYFKQQMNKRRGPGKGGDRENMLFKGLDLTDDQKSKIKDIMTDARKKAQKAQGPERFEIMKNAMDKVTSDVLTKEQAAKLKEKFEKFRKGPGNRPRMKHPLAGIASKEQMKQIDEIMSDAFKKAKDASPEERRKIMQAAREKVANEVLTEEQRDKLNQRIKEMRKQRRGGERGPRADKRGKDACGEECDKQGSEGDRKGLRGDRRRGPRGGMMKDLTEDQKAAAKKIMDEAREKAKDASPEERREIMKAAFEKINKEVLTDEQREKMKKMRSGRRGGEDGQKGPRRRPDECDGDDSEGQDGPPPPPEEDDEE